MRRKEEEIKISKEEREILKEEIKRFFSEERDEEIGDLASTILLDFISKKIAPVYYNQGIKDSIAYMNEKVDELYSLEK